MDETFRAIGSRAHRTLKPASNAESMDEQAMRDLAGTKKAPCSVFARENFLKIGFEACFFLCNPTTSSLPL